MPYQHILVAVDLTEECDPVVVRAQKLAQASGAKMSLVHIVEPMAMAFGGDVPMDLSMLQQQQFDQARERMNGFAEAMFEGFHEVLRPGGVLGVVEDELAVQIHQPALPKICGTRSSAAAKASISSVVV